MLLWVNDTNALDRARQLMADLQSAARAKDLAAALDLYTGDAAVLGPGDANFDREAVTRHVELVLSQPGRARWDWETIEVVDARPDAITFVALGTAGWDAGPDDGVVPYRMSCLVVDDGDRWRFRLQHGAVTEI
jgi:uncharacterized protein (TIGR02246 family)